jgi:hypothetical protein
VNARDAEGNTPLILASFYAGPQCVELLLEKGADPNAANRSGVTALIRAATDYEKTRLLIGADAKVGDFPEANYSRTATRVVASELERQRRGGQDPDRPRREGRRP